MTANSRRAPHHRRGMILVAGMMCLLLATMVAGNILATVVRGHRLVDDVHRRLQAEWLVEAGLERGLAAVRADADYAGEEWTVPPEDLDGPFGGRVEITIDRTEDDRVRITSRAAYPPDIDTRATAERTIRVATPTEDDQT